MYRFSLRVIVHEPFSFLFLSHISPSSARKSFLFILCPKETKYCTRTASLLLSSTFFALLPYIESSPKTFQTATIGSHFPTLQRPPAVRFRRSFPRHSLCQCALGSSLRCRSSSPERKDAIEEPKSKEKEAAEDVQQLVARLRCTLGSCVRLVPKLIELPNNAETIIPTLLKPLARCTANRSFSAAAEASIRSPFSRPGKSKSSASPSLCFCDVLSRFFIMLLFSRPRFSLRLFFLSFYSLFF
ncbi:hypothetical protein BJX64DRAFT_30335 [Aspergillus heterothallicus]